MNVLIPYHRPHQEEVQVEAHRMKNFVKSEGIIVWPRPKKKKCSSIVDYLVHLKPNVSAVLHDKCPLMEASLSLGSRRKDRIAI